MKATEESKLVIMFDYEDGDFGYLSGVYENTQGEMQVSTGYELEDATDLSNHTKEDIYELFLKFQEFHEDYDCELVRITTKVTVEDVETDDDTIKELRQKFALSKLNERDIKALGIANIATYIKTKFHNA